MRFLLITMVLLLPACSQKSEAPPAQTTTFLISGPETVRAPQIAVRSFAIEQETVTRGNPVRLTMQLDVPGEVRTVAIDWHAPDGWVVAHQVRDVTEGRLTVDAPEAIFEKPGRYRAVLRSGLRSLAEDSVSVTR